MQGVRDEGCIFNKAVLSLLICIIFRAQGVPELTCPPGIIEVGTSAGLICSTSAGNVTLMYTGPNGITVQCDMKTGSSFCPTGQGYTSSVLNDTHMQMEVKSVKPAHGGNWTCKEGGGDAADYCFVFVKQTPPCKISSNMDTGALALYEATSLTVDVQGYYCSAASSFSLQVGSVTQPLSAPRDVAAITDVMLNTTLNIIHAHFGDVRLVFTCGNIKKSLKCDGVSYLKENSVFQPPSLLVGVGINVAVCVTMFLLYKGAVCIYRKLYPGRGCTAFSESVHVPSLPHAQTSGQDQSVEDRGDDYAALEMDATTRNMYEQVAV